MRRFLRSSEHVNGHAPVARMAAKAVEELLAEAFDLVRRSVPPERRDAERANLTAVANEIVAGIRARPWGAGSCSPTPRSP